MINLCSVHLQISIMCEKGMNTKIKLMLLAIQKDNFDLFQTHFEECVKDIDKKNITNPSNIINNLRRNTSEDSAVHIAAQYGRISILRYVW